MTINSIVQFVTVFQDCNSITLNTEVRINDHDSDLSQALDSAFFLRLMAGSCALAFVVLPLDVFTGYLLLYLYLSSSLARPLALVSLSFDTHTFTHQLILLCQFTHCRFISVLLIDTLLLLVFHLFCVVLLSFTAAILFCFASTKSK